MSKTTTSTKIDTSPNPTTDIEEERPMSSNQRFLAITMPISLIGALILLFIVIVL